jgi:uncharacterized protein (DUF885 family)
MKKLSSSLLLLVGIIGLIVGCTNQSGQQTPSNTDTSQQQTSQAFKQATEQFIEDLWVESPGWGSWVGYHKFDHVLRIPNETGREQSLAFVTNQRQRFARFDVNILNDNEKTDYYLILNQLEQIQWNLKVEKSHQWDPSQYNVAGVFSLILNGNYDTLDNRLTSVLQRLAAVPQFYKAAMNNISHPTIEHTQLGIAQNQGALSVFGDELVKKVDASGLTTQQKNLFKSRIVDANTAINGYISFLQNLSTQLEQSGNARNFRLGEKLYETKFALEIQSEYTAAQMYQKALEDKTTVLQQMTVLTNRLWPKYFADKPKPANDNKAINALIKHISVKHVKGANFVDEIRQQIPALEAFVKEKDLISLDPEKPLVVRETPLYMRGIAGASINAPGPYDKKANTYYNVTPLDDMDEQQVESYLREYNHWLLQILNIHEAIPGHYTQLVYANESESQIKAILGNAAMIEGWAVYTERMMLEEGYGNFEPELWLMYYKWNLRVIANTILDYGVHVKNMTKTQAMDLLMNQVFQEKTEAEGKWRRVTLSQVQLTSYYSGYREIYDFRAQMKKKAAKQFNLKAFHEQFLSYGSAPVKYIKQLMVK